jgi:hypothetical protein
MKVNLTARVLPSDESAISSNAVCLTIRPAGSLPGDYTYTMDRRSLLIMLRRQTELRLATLDDFDRQLSISKRAFLSRVELSDRALTELGYFVD